MCLHAPVFQPPGDAPPALQPLGEAAAGAGGATFQPPEAGAAAAGAGGTTPQPAAAGAAAAGAGGATPQAGAGT